MSVFRLWHSLTVCISLACAMSAQVVRAADAVAEGSGDDAAQAAVEGSTDADTSPANAEENSTGSTPTHKQLLLININSDGLSEATVLCFCLQDDDTLLAGCKGSAKEIRVFSKDGKYIRSIELPVNPEAINVAPDGMLLVAGEGKLLRLSGEGKVESEAAAPHAEALSESREALREEVVEQHKQQAEMLPTMLESYDEAMATLEEQLEEIGDDEEREAERDSLKETLAMYEEAKDQLKEQYGGDSAEELTEEKIEELVTESLQYKMEVASISATEDAVFIACRSTVGHGYDVWRTTPEFADAEQIVTGLSGCCGQMDVQANGDGVFVAENSRKRVRRFDDEGKSICDWGKSTEGVDGFGSCCNPMNLAFGPGGAVYTAEDTTGRIKKYSITGDLLSVVGSAEVVPGCKKVSIGVDSSGDRVYMLDITTNNVAVLSRVLPDPTGPIVDAEDASSGGGFLDWLGLGS